MIERVALAGQAPRSAHHRSAAKLTEVLTHTPGLAGLGGTARQIGEINFQIAGNEKIQSAIAVIVAPRRACAPALARHSELFRHIGKRAVAIVVIET